MAHEFLEYSAADHEAARGTSYVRHLVEYLQWEAKRGEEATFALTRAKKHDEAYFAAAKTEAVLELLATMTPPPQQPVASGDEYEDPNLPPAARR